MKKIIFCIILLYNLNPCFSQDFGLPRYMTEDEKRIGNDYVSLPPVNAFPPPNPVRTMAEWEELDGIVLTWTSYQFLLRQIVDAAQEEGMVWIICTDSNSVKSYLQGGGIPLYNIAFIIAPYNSVWSRDYGPWCVYTLQGDTLGFTDFKYNRPRPLDDVIPGVLANRWSLPIYQTISGQDSLAHPGGNFMVDGFGTGFASKLIEMENSWHTPAHIDSILFRYCGIGIGRMVRMTVLPYDGIHHIDMHMKMLDEETILVGQYPTGVSDGPQIEANIQFIQNNYLNCYGRPYKIVRIPMPPSPSGQYPPNSYYYTYVNSTFINRTILVPIYNYNINLDTIALRIYRENLPGYTVIGYDCNQIIPAGGAIHCINKEIGTKNPVLIYHARLQNTTDTVNNYPVLANIKNRYGIDSALVYWATDTLLGYNRAVMTNSGGQNWTGSIPRQSAGRTVYYYIKARTNNGKYFSKPITAPRGHWKFNILGPTGISINGNTIPGRYRLYQNYPNPFNPTTNINFDIPKSSFVKLVVYDILGREVTVLINENLNAGSYKYEWNASNLTSGVYFYKLQTEEFKDVRKIILIK
ncbi:MAG: agmatine deiminase family protein [Ignavibacteria bacterium]